MTPMNAVPAGSFAGLLHDFPKAETATRHATATFGLAPEPLVNDKCEPAGTVFAEACVACGRRAERPRVSAAGR